MAQQSVEVDYEEVGGGGVLFVAGKSMMRLACFLLLVVCTKRGGSILCPATHHRCGCEVRGERGAKSQSLICSGVWSLPLLNDSVPAATGEWELVLEDSNDLGVIPLHAFSEVRRHVVSIEQNARLGTVENHAFKGARIDHLSISGYPGRSIELVESEAFNQLQSLSKNIRDCDWDKSGKHLECSTSISLTSVAVFQLSAKSFVSFVSLQDLYLNVERLDIAPGAMESMSQLRQLRIIGSKFTPTEASFRGLASLKVLHLNSMGLGWLPSGLFQHMPRLELLSLRRNQLATIPSDAGALQHIFLVDLSDNRITDNSWKELPTQPWPALKFLYLEHNSLTTPPAWLSGLENVEEVKLAENTLLCDCSLIWLNRWRPLTLQGWTVFGDMVATCSTANWKTCSRVCPFNCRLEQCVKGLESKECGGGKLAETSKGKATSRKSSVDGMKAVTAAGSECCHLKSWVLLSLMSFTQRINVVL